MVLTTNNVVDPTLPVTDQRRVADRYIWAWTWTIALILLPAASIAQEPDRGTSIRDLPRRGYEPRDIRLGGTVIRLESDAALTYDTNIFARPAARDDVIFELRPRITATTDSGASRTRLQAYANVRELLDNGRESSVAFGVSGQGSQAFSRENSIVVNAQYDRAIESRADPERRAGVLDPPRKIDALLSEFRFVHRGARFGFDLGGAVQRFDYLSAVDDDRDLNIYRASAIGSVRMASLDIFAEAYVNRRDFHRAFDFTGVDRDATTYGILFGARRELTGRLRGRLGIGAFRSEPSDPSLRPFSGVAASGEVTWSPRPRTAVTLSAFSGDVATVRSGASGRTDTRIGFRIEQEARHNLILRAGGSYLNTKFRGVSAQSQTTFSGDVEAEYLLNGQLTAFATAAYTKRSADRPFDRFKRAFFGLGVRFRY